MFKFNESHLAKPYYRSAVVFNPRNPLYQNIKQEVQEQEKEKTKPKFYQKNSSAK